MRKGNAYDIRVVLNVDETQLLTAKKALADIKREASETARRAEAAVNPRNIGQAGFDSAFRTARTNTATARNFYEGASRSFTAEAEERMDAFLRLSREFPEGGFDAMGAEARMRAFSVLGINPNAPDPPTPLGKGASDDQRRAFERQRRERDRYFNDIANRERGLLQFKAFIDDPENIQRARQFDSLGRFRGPNQLVREDTARRTLARAVATGDNILLGKLGFEVTDPSILGARAGARDAGIEGAMQTLRRNADESAKAVAALIQIDEQLIAEKRKLLAAIERETNAREREARRIDQENVRAIRQTLSNNALTATGINMNRDEARLRRLMEPGATQDISRILSLTDADWKGLDPSERRRLLDYSSSIRDDIRFYSRGRFSGPSGFILHKVADQVTSTLQGSGITTPQDQLAGLLQSATRRGVTIDNAVNAQAPRTLGPLDRIRAFMGVAPAVHAPGHATPYNRDYNTVFNRYNERLSNVAQMSGLSLYGLGSIGLMTALGGLTTSLYSEAQNQQLMIAGTLNTYMDYGGGGNRGMAFLNARRQGAQLYEDLRQRAEVSVLNTTELADYFISGGPQLMRSGLTSQDTLQIVDQIAAIGKSMGYQSPAIQSDIRDLASGGITVRSQVLRAIGMSRAGLERAQQGGPEALKAYFDETLSGFGPALAEIQNTPMGRINQVLDRLQRSGISVGEGFFSGIDQPLSDVASALKELNDSEGLLENAGRNFGGFVGTVISAAAQIMASPIGGIMANPVTAIMTGLGGYAAISTWRERTNFRTQAWMQMDEAHRAARPLNYASLVTEGSWLDRTIGGVVAASPGDADYQNQVDRRNQRISRASRVLSGIGQAAAIGTVALIGAEVVDWASANMGATNNRFSTQSRDSLTFNYTEGDTMSEPARREALRSLVQQGQVTGDESAFNQRAAAAISALYSATPSTTFMDMVRGSFGLFRGEATAGQAGFGQRLTSQLAEYSRQLARGRSQDDALAGLDLSEAEREAFRALVGSLPGRDRFSDIGRMSDGQRTAAIRDMLARVGFTGSAASGGVGPLGSAIPISFASTQMNRAGVESVLNTAFGSYNVTPEQAARINAQFRSSGQQGINNPAIRALATEIIKSSQGVLRQNFEQSMTEYTEIAGFQGALASALTSRQQAAIQRRGPANANAIYDLNRIRSLQRYQADLAYGQEAMQNPEMARIRRQDSLDQAEESYLSSIRALRLEITERNRNTEALRRSTEAMRVTAQADRAEFDLNLRGGAFMASREGLREQFRIFDLRGQASGLEARNSIQAAGAEVDAAMIMTADLQETNAFFKTLLSQGLPPVQIDEMSYAGISTEFRVHGELMQKLNDAVTIEFGNSVRTFEGISEKLTKGIAELEAAIEALIEEMSGAPSDIPAMDVVNNALAATGAREPSIPQAVAGGVGAVLGGVRNLWDNTTAGLSRMTTNLRRWSESTFGSGSAIQNFGIGIQNWSESAFGPGSDLQRRAAEATGAPVPSPSPTPSRDPELNRGAPMPMAGRRAPLDISVTARQVHQFRSPLQGIDQPRLTSGFGPRRHPIHGDMRQHRGVDFGAKAGTPVVATASGQVKFSGVQRGYGNVIYIDHGNGVETVYAHLNGRRMAPVGARVRQGDVIGEAGSTGDSTGPHLHYEVRENGRHIDPKSEYAINLIATGSRRGSQGTTTIDGLIGSQGSRLSGAQRDLVSRTIDEAASRYGVDPSLIAAVIQAESNFNPQAVSSAGAQGLMQLMPGTARSLGVTDPFDIRQNIMAGTRYLSQQIQTFGSVELGLAAYNAGPGNVRRAGNRIPNFAETQAYVPRVLGFQRNINAARSGRVGTAVTDQSSAQIDFAAEQARIARERERMQFAQAVAAGADFITNIAAQGATIESRFAVQRAAAESPLEYVRAAQAYRLERGTFAIEQDYEERMTGLRADLSRKVEELSRLSPADRERRLGEIEAIQISMGELTVSRQDRIRDLEIATNRAVRTAEKLNEEFQKSLDFAVSLADSVSNMNVAVYGSVGMANAGITAQMAQSNFRLDMFSMQRAEVAKELAKLGPDTTNRFTPFGSMVGAAYDAIRGGLMGRMAAISESINREQRVGMDLASEDRLLSAARSRGQALAMLPIQTGLDRAQQSYDRQFEEAFGGVGRADLVRRGFADRDATLQGDVSRYRLRLEEQFVAEGRAAGMSATEIANRLAEAGPEMDRQAEQYRLRRLQARAGGAGRDIAAIRAAEEMDLMAGVGSSAVGAFMNDPLGVFQGRAGTFVSQSLAGPLGAFNSAASARGTVLGRLIDGQRLTDADLAQIRLRRDPKTRAILNAQGRRVSDVRGVLTSQVAGDVLGPMVGTWFGTALGGSEESSMLGSQVGSMVGPSLFAGLGAWGGPVGAVVGGALGGLFGRRRNPQDEENRNWRDNVVRLLSSMDKSLRREGDLARMFRGAAYVGQDSRYFAGRYNNSASRDLTLGEIRR